MGILGLAVEGYRAHSKIENVKSYFVRAKLSEIALKAMASF
jgi:hypothetical protein